MFSKNFIHDATSSLKLLYATISLRESQSRCSTALAVMKAQTVLHHQKRKDLPRASEAPWKGPKASQGRPRPVNPSQGVPEALFKFTRPRKGVPGLSALGSPRAPLEGLGALARALQAILPLEYKNEDELSYKGHHASEKTYKDELLMREGCCQKTYKGILTEGGRATRS
ncbi:hypothetical protein FB451DRAFT_1195212 [Mycena latifolia]|nr:hypothetical protein FB451DRAFT_1195212 [Mycena latifolia]